MSTLVTRRGQLLGLLAAGSLFLATGCGNAENNPAGQSSLSAERKNEQPADSVNPPVLAEPRLRQPMKDAVAFDPPENQLPPPDVTFAKKIVGKLHNTIVGKDGVGGLWDQIHFVSATGKPLCYTALFTTDEGTIVVELWPQAAPNHVRNFIALAKVGYFDGLPFHRAVNQNLDGKSLTYLEAGCPKGTGEIGYGSIGYWLKPEIDDKLQHEEGTLGAWHDEALDSAACKFYITLCPAPWMDKSYTIFGKVTQGLDVAHKIHKRPVTEEDPDRPRQPVLIREVTIQVSEETLSAKR